MKLVIVESPKKCDTIGRYLGSDYKVMASQGHIRDLSTRGRGGLGIDVERGFVPDFVINPDKKKIVDGLRRTARSADEVILATDPDREGEAISWHLAQVLDLDVKTTKRLQFHEITRPAVLSALENPGLIDMNLVESQETRRMYDRIIGFKLSGLLQRKMDQKSAGRVQSVTLKMICDNDAEIKAFVPEEYWTISIDLEIEGKIYSCPLDKVNGKTLSVKTEEEAAALVKLIPEEIPLVSLLKSKKKVPSRLPLITSTMQQEAFSRFGFSTSKTQSIAQRLYEGMDIAGEHVGLITYMRTDSIRISPEFFEKHAKPFILEEFGPEYLGRIKTGMNKKGERVQDAHEAIRPTGTHRTPDIVARYVSADEAKLYRLIYERAMGSLMSDKLVEVTTASFEANGLSFKMSGNRTLFSGYEAVYGKDREKDDELPNLSEGKTYAVKEAKKEQKFTKAPARYSEAKVVKMMEEEGIGRPSTYATTIKTLIARGYVTSNKGILTPTENGLRTTFVLNKYFPEILSTKYTAGMESTLDEIEEGKRSELEAMEEFYYPFITKFEEVEKKMYKDPDQETGEMCPLCGSPLVIKKSRYGSFVACSNYPNCHYIKREAREKPVETGEMCPRCGKPLVIRHDRKGKEFVACSGYPNCNYIKGKEENAKKVAYTEEDYVKPCPSCGKGHLVLKHGRRVDFLGCTNFPKCRYHEWLTAKDGRRKKDE